VDCFFHGITRILLWKLWSLILMFYEIVACFRLVHLTSWKLLQALMDLTSMVSPETSQRLDWGNLHGEYLSVYHFHSEILFPCLPVKHLNGRHCLFNQSTHANGPRYINLVSFLDKLWTYSLYQLVILINNCIWAYQKSEMWAEIMIKLSSISLKVWYLSA
jgi:hypothetical protein